jgi:hypothetical protein
MTARTVLLLPVVALGSMATGCGDDGGGRTDCGSVLSRLCSMACACTEGDECWFRTEDPEVDDIVRLGAEGECPAFVATSCEGAGDEPEAEAFFRGCDSALDRADCHDSGEGNTALYVPGQCH